MTTLAEQIILNIKTIVTGQAQVNQLTDSTNRLGDAANRLDGAYRDANGRLRDAQGREVGWAGELHPQVCKEQDLPERTAAMELDFSRLAEGLGEPVQAAPISVFPPTDQDVALIVDEQLPAAELVQTLREGAGELLEQVRVFDDYRGTGMDEGKKSLACSLRFRAPDRTLTHEEATQSRERAIELAAQRHGAVLR